MSQPKYKYIKMILDGNNIPWLPSIDEVIDIQRIKLRTTLVYDHLICFQISKIPAHIHSYTVQ